MKYLVIIYIICSLLFTVPMLQKVRETQGLKPKKVSITDFICVELVSTIIFPITIVMYLIYNDKCILYCESGD